MVVIADSTMEIVDVRPTSLECAHTHNLSDLASAVSMLAVDVEVNVSVAVVGGEEVPKLESLRHAWDERAFRAPKQITTP